LAVFVFACVAMGGCRRATPSEEAATGPIAVATQPVQLGSLQSTISGPGTIVPSTAADWTIFPPESGRIAELPKAEGDAVQAGDVLVKFDFANLESDLAARQVQVQAATGQLDAAKSDLTRISAMYDRGYVPRNDFEAARNAVSQAETELTRAKQLLDVAKAAAERAVIKARFSGVIAKRFHQEGDLVNGAISDPVLRVIDPTRTQVAMRVPVQQVPLILPGQRGTVVSATGPVGDPVSVVSRPTIDDPAASSVEVRLAFNNPSTLPVDSPVQVELLVDQRTNVMVLPTTAVLKADDGTSFVMTAGSDGRAHRRAVRLGLTTKDRVEILSGISVGDRLIVKGLEQVADGTPITISQ
jgi:RND family efflux transporter MFP subunit